MKRNETNEHVWRAPICCCCRASVPETLAACTKLATDWTAVCTQSSGANGRCAMRGRGRGEAVRDESKGWGWERGRTEGDGKGRGKEAVLVTCFERGYVTM